MKIVKGNVKYQLKSNYSLLFGLKNCVEKRLNVSSTGIPSLAMDILL